MRSPKKDQKHQKTQKKTSKNTKNIKNPKHKKKHKTKTKKTPPGGGLRCTNIFSFNRICDYSGAGLDDIVVLIDAGLTRLHKKQFYEAINSSLLPAPGTLGIQEKRVIHRYRFGPFLFVVFVFVFFHCFILVLGFGVFFVFFKFLAFF